MSGKRQKNQNQLAFWFAGASEACFDGQEGTVTPVVEREAESPAGNQQLMEEVVERENLKRHWTAIREQLMGGTYEPQPVKRVEIAKPDGGVRKLGVPTVVDRL